MGNLSFIGFTQKTFIEKELESKILIWANDWMINPADFKVSINKLNYRKRDFPEKPSCASGGRDKYVEIENASYILPRLCFGEKYIEFSENYAELEGKFVEEASNSLSSIIIGSKRDSKEASLKEGSVGASILWSRIDVLFNDYIIGINVDNFILKNIYSKKMVPNKETIHLLPRSESLGSQNVALKVFLPKSTHKLSDIANLKVGDVLSINASLTSPLFVHVGQRDILEVFLGKNEEYKHVIL